MFANISQYAVFDGIHLSVRIWLYGVRGGILQDTIEPFIGANTIQTLSMFAQSVRRFLRYPSVRICMVEVSLGYQTLDKSVTMSSVCLYGVRGGILQDTIEPFIGANTIQVCPYL